ncbi:MAG: DUF819 family protein [Bacteroidales bacterium]|jgi:uncharacterized membrane protein|nr:DUF819 family protein [Bacteroidales bacterium]
MAAILLTLFYIFSPVIILYLCNKFSLLNKIGAVLLAYATGLILGNIGVLPDHALQIQDIMTTLTIPLAIPLLLFSANIKSWFTIAGKTMLSMVIALFSVVIVVFAGFFIFRGQITELWKIGGMLVGLYSGGTPNLASLKLLLDVKPEAFIVTHTFDMIISAIYLLFLLTVGQKLFGYILPQYKNRTPDEKQKKDGLSFTNYWGFWNKKYRMPLLAALGVSVIIFGIAGGLSLLVPENSQMVVVILTITTLGILGSFIPRINRIAKTFDLGMYLILIFSVVVASMADITQFNGSAPELLAYISFVIFGALFLHVLFSRLFKVDADTVMITSTALICSPPFVPVIAGAIKNKEIIISGLTVGIIGYALGNYLGFLVAGMLKIL